MRLATVYITLLVILLSYGTYNDYKQQSNTRDVPKKTQNVIVATIHYQKASSEALQIYSFLKKYDSPLQDNAVDFYEASKEYGIDYKVLVAISGVESTFAKNIASGSFNAWGYMCSNTVCYFKSFREGIYKVAKTISRERAYAEYRRTGQIYDLAKPYNYVSPDEWTNKLNYFINRI